MNIPPLDLQKEYQGFRKELGRILPRVLASGHFILGEEVRAFENSFAKKMGTKCGIGVASGSDALLLALMALGVHAGDEVITTPFTFIATATAIARLGAKPVFADIDPDTFQINPSEIEKKLTELTKAILPVHLYGLACDMSAIMKLAKEHNVSVVEDCAQSAGARWKGKPTGSFGELGAFSFYPTKTLGAYGDGGMITTGNEKLHELLLSLRAHGSKGGKYRHEFVGINSRLDEIQAAILNVKLKRLGRANERRRKAGRLYDALFECAKIRAVRVPKPAKDVTCVYHQYAIYAGNRDALLTHLQSKGIAANVYYPIPLHLQPCFSYLGYKKGDFPNTEQASESVLNLPIFPEISPAQQKFVVSSIQEFYAS